MIYSITNPHTGNRFKPDHPLVEKAYEFIEHRDDRKLLGYIGASLLSQMKPILDLSPGLVTYEDGANLTFTGFVPCYIGGILHGFGRYSQKRSLIDAMQRVIDGQKSDAQLEVDALAISAAVCAVSSFSSGWEVNQSNAVQLGVGICEVGISQRGKGNTPQINLREFLYAYSRRVFSNSQMIMKSAVTAINLLKLD